MKAYCVKQCTYSQEQSTVLLFAVWLVGYCLTALSARTGYITGTNTR